MSTWVIESDNENGATTVLTRTVLLLSAGWFLAVLSTAWSGGFDAAAGERPVAIVAAIIAPILVYSLSYLAITPFRQWVLGLDMRHLILLHSWRMVGMGFVFLYFQDRLPALFALPAGLGDAMAAAGAIFLAIAMYERPSTISTRRIFTWNTFGLVDFAAAVSLGVMTRAGDVLHMTGAVDSNSMGTFPLALIPAFAVPFYVITHLIIYAQLRRRR
jgi:hypothetical protein